MSEPPADSPESAEPPMIDVTPDATSASAPPRRRRISLHDARWVVLGVALLLLAGAAIWWLVPALPPAPSASPLADTLKQMDDRLAALAQRQAALDQTLARLEQQPPRGSEPAARQEEIAVLRQLAERIALLEQHAETPPADAAALAALKDELHQIGDRLDKIETAPVPPTPPAAEERPPQDLLVALTPLEGALRGARPFSAELARLETAAQDRPEVKAALAPLEALAPQGLPSLATLTRRFEQDVAPAVMRSAMAPEDADWGDRVLSELRGLVVVRRTGAAGAQSKDPVEAALARTEQALVASDLAAAVAALEGLPSRAAGPAKEWLAAAKSRLGAEAAMATLERLATANPEMPER
jgi:hypothetical protein